MAILRELGAGLQVGLATATTRPRYTLLIAAGFVIAGITLAVLLTIPAGLRRLAGRTGSPDVAVVLPSGTVEETGGTFEPALANLVGTLPGVAIGRSGSPLVAPQFVVATRMRRKDGTTATVLIRGVTPSIWRVAGDTIKIRSGRRFRPGRDELIAGAAADRAFVSLGVGTTVSIHNTTWHVSGEFSANGGFWESQLWGDMSALQATFHAQGKVTCLWVKLASPAAFNRFRKALHDDPLTRGLHAVRQPDYYISQSGYLESAIVVVTQVIAVILGLGAILAIVNALGIAFYARRRDLAVLRALGFQRGALSFSLLIEVLVIGVICAGVALLAVWLGVNGRGVGSSTFTSAIQFRLRVDGSVVLWTVAYVLILGVLSALWPITQALRTPLTKTLHGE